VSRRLVVAGLTAFAGIGLLTAAEMKPADLRRVVPNDNRRPAGSLRGGVLTLRLEVRTGVWYPEGPRGDSVVAPVFAEEGKAAQVPGPLIRVPAGTMIEATLRNALADSALHFHGFSTRPAGSDSGPGDLPLLGRRRCTRHQPGRAGAARGGPGGGFSRRPAG
jgi:FtsP/CotA-like multicopper oxidase with cupredoxin domain